MFSLVPIREPSGTGSFCGALGAKCACPPLCGRFSERLLTPNSPAGPPRSSNAALLAVHHYSQNVRPRHIPIWQPFHTFCNFATKCPLLAPCAAKSVSS